MDQAKKSYTPISGQSGFYPNLSPIKINRSLRFKRKQKHKKDYRPKEFSFSAEEKAMNKTQRRKNKVKMKSTPWRLWNPSSIYWEMVLSNGSRLYISSKLEREIFSYEYPDDPWDHMLFTPQKKKPHLWEYY